MWNSKSSGEERFIDEFLNDELAEIRNATVNNLVEKHVKREEQNLGVEEGLLDLVPLDSSIENSSSSEFGTSDKNSLVLETESLGGDDVVWKEPQYQATPEDGHCTADEEDQFPNWE